MRLGYKVLVPQLLLLGLLLATSGALLIDLQGQEKDLRLTRHRLEDATRLAEHVKDLHGAVAMEVLSYRLDRRPARVEAMRLADDEVAKALEAYAAPLSDAKEQALLGAVAESRNRIRDSRSRFVGAIDSGSEPGIQAAFERWQIHRRLLEANLADLSAFSLDRFASSSERVTRERVGVTRDSLYGVAAAMVIVAAAFFYIRASVSRPLALLVSGIAAFGSGKLGVRLDPRLERSSDEIGQVARAFDAMAGDIEGLSRDLERRVAERTAQLEAANKELEAFAYSVSHDLRAPLRSIDGFSQALLEDYEAKLDDEGKDSLHRVRAASQRMGQLIDDMLKLSRATRAEMEIGPVDLSAVAESTVAELHRLEPERKVTVSIAPGIIGRGDARLLGTVMENLFSNAWKFTGTKALACIEFAAEKKDGELVCRVRDDGAGFDMAYAGNLFAPFQRLHQASQFPGTGIGLATVKRVITRLGGRVWAQGEVDKGATFYFSLPDTSTQAG